MHRNSSASGNGDGGIGAPGTDGVRQSKPMLFYGGSKPPCPALVGLVGALLLDGTTLRKEPKSNISKLPEAPGVLLQGWDRGRSRLELAVGFPLVCGCEQSKSGICDKR